MRFHLAIPIGESFEKILPFYTDILGCGLGPGEKGWQDVDFFGHELTLHIGEPHLVKERHDVDMGAVCVPHFGAWLDVKTYEGVKKSIVEKWQYFDKPYLRFEGQETEQETFFVQCPIGYVLEIKTKKNEG